MKKLGKLKIRPSAEIAKSRVSIGFECLDRDMFKWEPCIEPLAETGVKYARVQSGWAKTEKEKGVYDFAWLDAIVDALIAKGIVIWMDICYGNPIYMPGVLHPSAVGCSPTLYGDECRTAWENYVRALVTHYKGRIGMWEIWNEPDGKPFWYPHDPNGTEMAELYMLTAKIVREVQPDAKVGCNIAGFSKEHRYELALIDGIDPAYMDFFIFHAYKRIPEVSHIHKARSFRKLLDARGFSHVEMWQGEAGYPSWAYKDHWMIHEGTDAERPQAVWMARRFFNDLKAGCTMSSFFQMADMWEKPYPKARDVLEKCAGHGILHGLTYEKKESHRTISIMANLLSGDIALSEETFTVEAEGVAEAAKASIAHHKWQADILAEMTDYIETVAFTRNGYAMYEFHAVYDAATEYHTPAKITLPRALAEPVVINCYTGEVFAVDDLSQMDLTEYAQVLCERAAIEIDAE
ncbi:MAG: beta-galactosidase [Clostridia bacterium]|nr:beta-galactosidase [Clostridia bacterium]